jgi:hypothetical protein
MGKVRVERTRHSSVFLRVRAAANGSHTPFKFCTTHPKNNAETCIGALVKSFNSMTG